MQQAQQESKLSPSPKGTVSPPAPSTRQVKGLPPLLRTRAAKSWGIYSQALGWVMALQRGTGWILSVAQPPPFVSYSYFSPRLPKLCPGTPPSLSPSTLTAALNNPSTSGQITGPWVCPKSRFEGHLLDKDWGRVAPESTSYSSTPAFAKGAFGVTTVAEEGKDTNRGYATTKLLHMLNK